MTLGVAVGMVATLMSGGRLSFLLCVMAGVFFAVIRGKLWLCLPFLAMTAAFSAIISANPDIYFSMPQLIQRATAPFNFSIDGADTKEVLQASDDWHKVLREQSIPYWMQDTTSFWLGHGFKSWDPNIPRGDISGFDYEHFVDLAIQMGLTENMFSSVTNIFGLAGLILYAAYMLHIAWQLYKGSRRSPVASFGRAACEFSLVLLLSYLILAPYAGYAPAFPMLYWVLGVIATREYISEKGKPSEAPLIPAFARPAFANQVADKAPRRRPQLGRAGSFRH